MEENIILKSVSADQFSAYFSSLNSAKRTAFVRANRREIAELKNQRILEILCEFGYMNALLPLVKSGIGAADQWIILYYSPERSRFHIYPTVDEEKEILAYAAKRLTIVKFLREQTTRFLDYTITQRLPFQRIVYENATQDVIDYLFNLACDKHSPVTQMSGAYLFARASYAVIKRYLLRIGSLSGSRTQVSFSMLKSLAVREDIAPEDKMELLLQTVNRMPVSLPTINKLREEGLLNF